MAQQGDPVALELEPLRAAVKEQGKFGCYMKFLINITSFELELNLTTFPIFRRFGSISKREWSK